MRKSITLKAFRGRLGNQLFQVHTALQLAKHLDLHVMLPAHKLRQISREIPRGNKAFEFLISRFLKDNFQEFIFENGIMTETSRYSTDRFILSKNLVIGSNYLSETFFPLLFEHPSDLMPLNLPESYFDQEPILALHFRGTDFVGWNSKALMRPEYYFNALDHFSAWKSDITLFTDDIGHEVVQTLIRNVPKLRVDKSMNTSQAFLRLAQHKILISSPSTFAIWAAMLGRSSTIVLEQGWINEMYLRDDHFWTGIATNRKALFSNVLIIP